MKTQYVGVIFNNDPGAFANFKENKIYYFKDNIGATIGDEVVVRKGDGQLAVVKVVTVSPDEPMINPAPFAYVISKVDKTDEQKRQKYLNNKKDASRLFSEVISQCLRCLSLRDAARTLTCTVEVSNKSASEIWKIFFAAENLQKETEAYEEEYGICASTSAK